MAGLRTSATVTVRLTRLSPPRSNPLYELINSGTAKQVATPSVLVDQPCVAELAQELIGVTALEWPCRAPCSTCRQSLDCELVVGHLERAQLARDRAVVGSSCHRPAKKSSRAYGEFPVGNGLSSFAPTLPVAPRCRMPPAHILEKNDKRIAPVDLIDHAHGGRAECTGQNALSLDRSKDRLACRSRSDDRR